MKTNSRSYNLLFQIELLESEFENFQINNCIFKYLTTKEIVQIKNKFKQLDLNSLFLEINLNSKRKDQVLNEALVKAENCMNIIRTYLSSYLTVQDENLLFNFSGFYLIKSNMIDVHQVAFHRYINYQKGFSWKISKEHFKKSNLENLFNYPINTKITSNIERAFRWFSLAIIETDHPSKIIKLCSSLESILTKKDERKKAEPLVYRMAYINNYFEKRYPNPRTLMAIYDIRSQAVHGSNIKIPKNKKFDRFIKEFHTEYSQLQFQTRRTINNYIKFINKHEIKDKNILFENIDTASEVSEFKDYFLSTYPEISKELFTS